MHVSRSQKLCQLLLPLTLANLSSLVTQSLPTQAAEALFPDSTQKPFFPTSTAQSEPIDVSLEEQDLKKPILPSPAPPEEIPGGIFFSNGIEFETIGDRKLAQVTPRDLPPPAPPLPTPEPAPLPPPEELLKPPSSSPTPTEELPSNSNDKFTISGFEFEGISAFSAEQLTAEISKFIKFQEGSASVSFADLLQARAIVTQLYIDAGYITSGAYIPTDQEFQDGGKVKIRVIEGELEPINVTGTRRLHSSYIRRRLEIATDKPFNQKRLLEALQLLRLDPLIKNLSAELSASSRPGKSFLNVKVEEASTFHSQLNFNNGRSPSVGSIRRGIQLSEANLLGFGDGLSFAYSNTDGSNAFDVSYSLPLSPYNTTLNLSYGTSSSSVIEPPFNTLGIESESRYYELTLRQPIIRTPRQEFAIGVTASRRESESSLSFENIGSFPLSPGADAKGRTRVSVVRFFQEYTNSSSKQVLAFRSQFSFGLDLLDSTINPIAPDSRFFAWRGQAQWVRLLGSDPDFLMLLRTDVQLADRTLLPVEQFGIGGLESVRGYRQDTLLTDNGIFASAELRIPILRIPQVRGVLQVTPFVEFGRGWNNDRPNPDPKTLVSGGLGLRLRLGNALTARLDWGIPFVSVNSNDRTLQEQGIYFSILCNPF